MIEELTPDTNPEPLPLEEQISSELVKHNYTEAKLQEFEEYLKLDIVDDDKESYLVIKEKRKEVKSYRVAVEKFCKFKREDAVKIQKAWVSKENELVEKISKVEDYLEGKEKAYEKKIAEEKEARKRKQEEQLIKRQQILTNMGAMYSDGNFILGDVSFELSAIKESEEDIWETILPKYEEEHKKIEAERLEEERLKKEKEAEFKRQQEELERKQKELEEKEAELKREAERQEKEAAAKAQEKLKSRAQQLTSLGHIYDKELEAFICYGAAVSDGCLKELDDEKWDKLVALESDRIKEKKEEESKQKRIEQERKELQSERLTELLPYNKYGSDVDMLTLGWLNADEYAAILSKKKREYEVEQEKEQKRIAEKAAKEERERIEEEQRMAKEKKRLAVIDSRVASLKQYTEVPHDVDALGDLTEDEWVELITKAKEEYEKTIREQEEERKAEELAKASEKVKWANILEQLSAIEIPKFISGQYARKAAILREKLEEIKAL